MSPVLSWLLFGTCILVGFVVYAAVVAAGRADRMAQTWTFTEPEDAHVRLYGGIYDAEARGDFEHDPLTCPSEVCAGRRRRAFNRLVDRPGSPRSADELMAAIREELARG